MRCRLCKTNKIKYDNLKICYECSKDRLIIKSEAKKEYGLSDKDMINIVYDIKKLGFGRKCNLYLIDDVEKVAIEKHGSKNNYKENSKKKKILKEEKQKIKENHIKRREKEIKDYLKEVGLKYRNDSKLIYQYTTDINDELGLTKEYVRDTMLEMDFYYNHTNYSDRLRTNRQIEKDDLFDQEYWLYDTYNDEDEERVRNKTKREVYKKYIKKYKNDKDKMILIPICIHKKYR